MQNIKSTENQYSLCLILQNFEIVFYLMVLFSCPSLFYKRKPHSKIKNLIELSSWSASKRESKVRTKWSGRL